MHVCLCIVRATVRTMDPGLDAQQSDTDTGHVDNSKTYRSREESREERREEKREEKRRDDGNVSTNPLCTRNGTTISSVRRNACSAVWRHRLSVQTKTEPTSVKTKSAIKSRGN